jgi:AAA domain
MTGQDEWDERVDEALGDQDQREIDRRYLALRGRLLDAKGLRNLPPPVPLIESWLNKNSLGWIQGKWGNAKTFVAVDVGCCVATGIDWHGHAVTQGRVLYLIAEGASGLSQRIDAWETAHDREATGIIFLPVPIRMADPYGVDVAAFRMLLVGFRPVLTIIDTQARVTVGAEENSSKDMGLFVDGLESLRTESGSTMLSVHHEPRTGENLRGSVALEGAADTIIRASKDGDVVTVTNLKQKDAEAATDLVLALKPSGPSAALYCQVTATAPDVMTESEQQILDALWQSFGSDETSASKLLTVSGVPDRTFYRSLKSLVDKGKVAKREAGNRVYYRRAHEQEETLFDG